MTNEQYTPISDQLGKLVWTTIHNDVFETDLSYAGTQNLVAKIMDSDWYAAEIAAAEQRGAVKALRDAADDMPGSAEGGHIDPYDKAAEWMIDRADQLDVDHE